MSVGESLGSHSLHLFAEFLQYHINSPEASPCLSSKRKPLKPLNVLKPFNLKFMAAEKSARKGGRKRHGETSRDLPDDLSELYKTDPEEDYNQRTNPMDSTLLGRTVVQVQIRDKGIC